MATDSKNVALVPLNGKNYSTWKVQCRMALMRDGLWNIVNNKEKIPTEGDKDILNFFQRVFLNMNEVVGRVQVSR